MKHAVLRLASIVAACLIATSIWGADRAYVPGSIWTITMVRVKPGMDSTYLTDLAENWRRVMDEARKQQLILSYKVLDGSAGNRDEWNLLLLVESRNWAAFDGADDKFSAIAEQMIGPEKKQLETMIKRSDVREIVGTRNLQEFVFK